MYTINNMHVYHQQYAINNTYTVLWYLAVSEKTEYANDCEDTSTTTAFLLAKKVRSRCGGYKMYLARN